jgi:hypothetical protein
VERVRVRKDEFVAVQIADGFTVYGLVQAEPLRL